jgi:hypothetical protein
MGLVVNGEEIDERVVEEEFDALKQHHESLGEMVCCDRDVEFRERALDHVIHRTLLRQECLRLLGEAPDAEIDEAIEELKRRHGNEEAFYRNTGYRPDQQDQIRQRVAETVNVTRILEHHLGPDPEPGDDELRAFQAECGAEFHTPEEVRAWHLYLEPHGNEDAVRCYELLRQARRDLRAGADFEELSRQLCRPDHVLDLGFYRQGSMVREVEIVTFSMEVGEISPVVSTHFGYHVFKVVDRKPPQPLPFDEIRDQLAARFVQTWRDRRIQELLDRLKAAGTVHRPDPQASVHD